MFAAKAGAKQGNSVNTFLIHSLTLLTTFFLVISVDNSAIIEKAKLNVKENGLDHIIT